MANKYLLRPAQQGLKEGFAFEDAEGNVVYEGKMLKFSLFGASPFEFNNHKTGKVEEHKLGKVVESQVGGNDWISALSLKSSFKYDGKNIWDYLHDEGIRIESTLSSNKIGMTYKVTYKGKDFATIASTTPKGKSIITSNMFFDVTCNEDDLDLAFLVSFAIARTNQIMYN